MATINDSIVYIDSDNILTLVGLKNNNTGLYANGATVTATIKNSSGVAISGETWPITLSYVAASNGDYKYTLPSVLVLVEESLYTVEVTVVDGGNNAFFKKDIRALFYELP